MEIINYIIYASIGVFILFIILGLAIVNFSFEQFASSFREKNVDNVSFSTATNLIDSVANFELQKKIGLQLTTKEFQESYNPRTNILKLNSTLADSSTVSALTVTAHELGHAKQNKLDKDKLDSFLTKRITASFFSKFSMPLFLLSIIFYFIMPELYFVSLIGLGISVLIFIISLSIKLSTIKVEKEASTFALEFLEQYAELNDYNLKEAKALLNDALRTYKADFLKSLLKWTFLVRN